MSELGSKKDFDLDISGVAGFFGGEVSVAAMATVHIYEGRRWLGWYNQPGSYKIAKRYGQLSRSRFWDVLYPGPNLDPATLFGYHGKDGPKFLSTQTGSVLQTKHIGRIFADACKKSREIVPSTHIRETDTPGYVTIATLANIPRKGDSTVARKTGVSTSILAAIPIIISSGACVGCGFIHDWYCLTVILLGIVTSGLSCYVIGLGTLKFKHPPTALHNAPGDGVLEDGGTELIVLQGPAGTINALTRGYFSLDYDSKPEYHTIGICSMLLTLQFVVQLLLIPQGYLHGQLFFLATLATSWAYNSYVASFDREGIQEDILIDEVLELRRDRDITRYKAGTRTTMVTFALLLLSPARPEALKRVLDDLLPNDTEVWCTWKSQVLERITSHFRARNLNDAPGDFDFGFPQRECSPDSEDPEDLLQTLYNDATAAAAMYVESKRDTARAAAQYQPPGHSARSKEQSTWGTLFCRSRKGSRSPA